LIEPGIETIKLKIEKDYLEGEKVSKETIEKTLRFIWDKEDGALHVITTTEA